jgi:hypothetical protein
MTIGSELLKELDREIRNSLDIPREWLPEKYQGKRATRKLSSVYNQLKRSEKNFDRDPRDVSVKFDASGNVTSATLSRLQAIENYRKQIENGAEANEQELTGRVNDDLQYNNLATFAGAMVLAGVLDREDFEE